MPWKFIIPALISTLAGGIQSGSAARQGELANRRTAETAEERRRMLFGLIDQINNTDYRNMDRAASAQFTQAADQIEALTAGRGTFGSGETGARNLQTRALSDVLIGLEAQKQADQLQRQQLVAQIMGDPSFGVPNPLLFDPQRAAVQAGLSGGVAGLAQAAGSFFGTDAGQAWLGSLGAPAPAKPGYNFAVRPTATPTPFPTLGAVPGIMGGGFAGGPFAAPGPAQSYVRPLPMWPAGQPRLVP